jgi:hypothetical protein
MKKIKLIGVCALCAITLTLSSCGAMMMAAMNEAMATDYYCYSGGCRYPVYMRYNNYRQPMYFYNNRYNRVVTVSFNDCRRRY